MQRGNKFLNSDLVLIDKSYGTRGEELWAPFGRRGEGIRKTPWRK
jgi:hypothetical protein